MALRINRQEPAATHERWEDYDEDVSFKLAGLDTEAYQIALERARRLIAREDAGQRLASINVSGNDVREHDVQCQLLGRYIIKDWKGDILDDAGDAVPYSPEGAAKLLSSNTDLFVWVIATAAQVAAGAQKEVKETVEKPSPGSSGKKNGPGKARSES
ncbi:hypothetical protein QP575_10355 [Alcaligenes faecalis subsp. phenolicus]|uniref:hypothetical protein n=1 Tax=Alcaligenes nematophilus TaxID=2994643 RepID=UPI002AA4F393|nr:hypothetical protein [Alcaligenes phenolicus]